MSFFRENRTDFLEVESNGEVEVMLMIVDVMLKIRVQRGGGDRSRYCFVFQI